MDTSLQAWALPRIKRLLPLDDESLVEILNYAVSSSKADGAEHLKNLLGDSSASLEFISSFSSRRQDRAPSTTQPNLHSEEDGRVPRASKPSSKKPKAPLHSTGPVRRPEGYGDITGAYQKSQAPDALQLPKLTQGGRASPGSGLSRDASPMGGATGSPRLPPSASGNLISEYMPNVRSKQAKKPASQNHSGTSTPNRSSTPVTTTTSSISDLTAAIAALELSTNPTLSSERRKCPCNASIHPLFATAPNCLSCGKIICALEGLQPCSYCDAPILTRDQVSSMIKALKEERGVERMAVHNAGQVASRSGTGTPAFGSTTPENGSGDETTSAASRARAHRDKLLSYQRENAQRTRVYDEAADYDMTLTPGTTQWMSPMQRAAALKRQQKYLREMEEANRPEWERKKTVMSLGVKNGKLVKTYGRAQAPASTVVDDGVGEDEEEVDGQPDAGGDSQRLGAGGKGAFSNNPLLKSGKLLRPIWRPRDQDTAEKGKGRDDAEGDSGSARTRKSVWRRVQDDNEDNEQWILDGGLRGYGTETRQMEDGSQQECG